MISESLIGQRHGKRLWWRLIAKALRIARRRQFDFVLFLPDDVDPVPGFFAETLRLWLLVDDPRKIALSLLVDERAGCLQWVPKTPRLVAFGGGDDDDTLWLQWWLDMAFFAPRNMLEVLRWKMIPIRRGHWDRHPEMPNRSSGAGRQISRRLYAAGYHIYSPRQTLVLHGGHPSQMHATSRKRPIARLA